MIVTTTITEATIRMELMPETELEGAVITHISGCCRVDSLPRKGDGALLLIFAVNGKSEGPPK